METTAAILSACPRAGFQTVAGRPRRDRLVSTLRRASCRLVVALLLGAAGACVVLVTFLIQLATHGARAKP